MLKVTIPTLYFDNDEDFMNFAIVPTLYLRTKTDKDGKLCRYRDYDFTCEYNNAVKNNVSFVIKDPNSLIFKHGGVCYRTITKPVPNLKDWALDKNFTFQYTK